MENVGKAIGALVYLAIWVMAVALYVVNIFKLIHETDPNITVEAVLRIIGIFMPPLGAIMGLI